jgi:hypothetical protein
MGYKAKTEATRRVDLSEGYYAMVRTLRKVDEDACQAALRGSAKITRTFTMVDGVANNESTQEFDNAAWTRELLVRGITSWTLDDDNDQPLPITYQTVDALTATDSSLLVVAIQGAGRALVAPEKNASSPA